MNSGPILYIQQIAVGSKTAEGSNPEGEVEGETAVKWLRTSH